MSSICDVCRPAADCDSISCNDCKVGSIYEIYNYNVEKPRQTAEVHMWVNGQAYTLQVNSKALDLDA